MCARVLVSNHDRYVTFHCAADVTACTQQMTQGAAVYNTGTATVIGPNVTFHGNTGASETIFNLGAIAWKCQLGYFKPPTGHYGDGTAGGALRTPT